MDEYVTHWMPRPEMPKIGSPVGPSGSQSLPVGSNKNESESESENVNKNENDSCSCSVSGNENRADASQSPQEEGSVYVTIPFSWLVKFCTHIDFKEPLTDAEREKLWRKKLKQQFNIVP